MPLADTKVRQIKPGEKAQKIADGGGLYLEVSVSGAKLWRFRYRIDKKENVFAIGEYPAVSLADARRMRDEAKALVKQGVHPAHYRREQRQAAAGERLNSFRSIADDWLDMREKKQHRTQKYLDEVRASLRRHVYSEIGGMAIRSIRSAHVLKILRRIEEAGHEAMAVRVRGLISQVFSYAIIKDLADVDPTYPLRNAIEMPKTKHARPLSAAEITDLMSRLGCYKGNAETVAAIRFLLYVFPRQAELRAAKVRQFDLDAARWDVPREIMKMRDMHVVPLSRQAVELLKGLIPEKAKPDDLVFPGSDGKSPLSLSTINAALRYMGYPPKHITGHDFRATASTHLNELGYRSDLIERQLAHAERDQSRAAYNHAEYLPERRAMLQAWADYIDGLESGALTATGLDSAAGSSAVNGFSAKIIPLEM